MPEVTFGVDLTDERTIRVPVPTDAATTEEFGKFLVHSAQEGYALSSAAEIRGGSQRDPYTVGMIVKVAR